jgi:hypothetical protein
MGRRRGEQVEAAEKKTDFQMIKNLDKVGVVNMWRGS